MLLLHDVDNAKAPVFLWDLFSFGKYIVRTTYSSI